jgi:hypothetical protein
MNSDKITYLSDHSQMANIHNLYLLLFLRVCDILIFGSDEDI